MILRRFIQHTKEQNWFAVGLDVIVVITGILLALAIEDAMQDRKDRVTEQEYLELLVRDLTLMEETLSAQVDFAERMLRLAAEADKMIIAGIDSADEAKLRSLLIDLATRRTLTLNSAAYEDLKSAGKLSLIRDADVRDAIVGLFFRTDRAVLVIEKNSGYFIDQRYDPFLREIGISYQIINDDWFTQDLSEELTNLRKAENEKLPSTMLNPVDAVLSSPKDSAIWSQIRQRLTWRASHAVNNNRFASAILEDVRATRTKIEAYSDELAQ